jgi:hypothetical protein
VGTHLYAGTRLLKEPKTGIGRMSNRQHGVVTQDASLPGTDIDNATGVDAAEALIPGATYVIDFPRRPGNTCVCRR